MQRGASVLDVELNGTGDLGNLLAQIESEQLLKQLVLLLDEHVDTSLGLLESLFTGGVKNPEGVPGGVSGSLYKVG